MPREGPWAPVTRLGCLLLSSVRGYTSLLPDPGLPQWDGSHLAFQGAVPGHITRAHGPCQLPRWPLPTTSPLHPEDASPGLVVSPVCMERAPLAQTLTVTFMLLWILQRLPTCQMGALAYWWVRGRRRESF